MLKKPTEQEWLLYETLSNPIGFSEVMFSDIDNLTRFDDNLIDIRIYQYSFFSYEYTLVYDPQLTERENFQMRKVVGDGYNYSGRTIGKTVCNSELDLLYRSWWASSEEVAFSSYDHNHLSKPLEAVARVADGHPIIKSMFTRATTSKFRFETIRGLKIYGVNTNIDGRSPGEGFVGLHCKVIYIEEASKESEKVKIKRNDSTSEQGAVFRFSGMTNFTKQTPAGKIFYDNTLQKYLIRYPRYISSTWGTEDKKEAIKKYNGEFSFGFKIFIEAEISEDGFSTYDIQRIKKNSLLEEKPIKEFEITKNNYKEDFFIEKPRNAEQTIVAADFGEKITEIGVYYKIDEIWHLIHAFRLVDLIEIEQYEFFKKFGYVIGFNYLYLDSTDGGGRVLVRRLQEDFGTDKVFGVHFNKKIKVDFLLENGKMVFDSDGNPKFREEYINEWSIVRIKYLLYNGILKMYFQERLVNQLNATISVQQSQRTLFRVNEDEDHSHQQLQVFAIAQFEQESNINQPVMKKDFCKCGV